MDFLSKNAIGIDISDYTIEIVEIKRQNKKSKVIKKGRAILEPDTVKNGEIKNAEKLKNALKKAINKAEPRAINVRKFVFVLPENQVYSYILNLEVNNEKKIGKIIEKKIAENIPVKKDNIVYSYKVIDKIEKEEEKSKTIKVAKKVFVFQILIIAIDNEIVQAWKSFFKNEMNMEVDIFDTEPQAIYRGLKKSKEADKEYCFVDIGADSTNISIFKNHILYYSYTFNAGGNHFTKNISEIKATADGKKIGLAKAETLKIENGLSNEGEYSKEINLILKNGLRTIAEEIKIAIEYIQETYKFEVTEITLLGGTSRLKGIKEYFGDYLKDISSASKAVVNPDIEKSDDKIEKGMTIRIGKTGFDDGKTPLEYIEATGAALRSLDSDYKHDIEIKPPTRRKKKKVKVKEEDVVNEENIEGDEEEQAEKKVSWVKSHPKEFQLLIILFIGCLLIPLAFWYRSYDEKKRAEVQSLEDKKYEETVILDYKIPINIDLTASIIDTIRGRIVKNTIEQPTDYDNILSLSMLELEKEKKETEAIWEKPVNEPVDKENLVFPLELEWMFYSEQNAKDLFLKKAKKNTENKFLLDSIDYMRISKDTVDDNIYYLEGSISILTSGSEKSKNENKEDIKDSESTEVSQSKEEKVTNEVKNDDNNQEMVENSEEKELKSDEAVVEEEPKEEDENKELTIEELMASLKRAKQVEILDTGIGYLNVRSGPSVANEIVIRVYPGEFYEKLDENNAWVKIKISEKQDGWVSSRYVE